MDKNDTLKISLIIVFFGVLISGVLITINNYRSWNSVKTSVTTEYKKAETSDTQPNAENEETPGNTDGTDETTDPADLQNEGSNVNDPQNENLNTDNPAENPDGQQNTDNLGEGQNIDSYDEQQNTDNSADGQNTDTHDEQQGTDNSGDDPDNEIDQDERNSEDTDNRETNMDMEGFYITEITDDIFERIKGKSFPESCTVSRDELRYVHIRHYGFEMEVRDGELIVNAAIARDVLEIFEELYNLKYQIEKVRLIDEYDADDERSMEANNSSCFNFRTIAESDKLSNHAYGRAIDINPFYNPYVYTRSDGSRFLQPKGSDRYVDRTVDAACIIRKGDVCYNTFIKHGFKWGGDWETKKDYQHFEKTD